MYCFHRQARIDYRYPLWFALRYYPVLPANPFEEEFVLHLEAALVSLSSCGRIPPASPRKAGGNIVLQ
jgi:hypothetical protein